MNSVNTSPQIAEALSEFRRLRTMSNDQVATEMESLNATLAKYLRPKGLALLAEIHTRLEARKNIYPQMTADDRRFSDAVVPHCVRQEE